MQPPPPPPTLTYVSTLNTTLFPPAYPTYSPYGSGYDFGIGSTNGLYFGIIITVTSNVTAFVLRSFTFRIGVFNLYSTTCDMPVLGPFSFEQNPLAFAVRSLGGAGPYTATATPKCILMAPGPVVLPTSGFADVTLVGDCYMAPGVYVIMGIHDLGLRTKCGVITNVEPRLFPQLTLSGGAPVSLNASEVYCDAWNRFSGLTAIGRSVLGPISGTPAPHFAVAGYTVKTAVPSPPPAPPPRERHHAHTHAHARSCACACVVAGYHHAALACVHTGQSAQAGWPA